MSFEREKRGEKRGVANPSPWERDAKEASYASDDINYISNYTLKRPKFYTYSKNMYLDIHTKRAALRTSASIVSLVSYSGGEEIFQGSGTIIESDDSSGIILTSADLIRSPMDRCSVADAIKCGVGGPVINHYGEVIGICFYDWPYSPFLPINVASKWWDHYKEKGETHRPWLGMELTNLYAASLDIVEKIVRKFPNTFKGVIVEEVIPGSSAHSAGICANDVIVRFGGRTIQSFLELVERMWDKVGDSVELDVLRPSNGAVLHLGMVVEEATPDKFYSWPLLEYAK